MLLRRAVTFTLAIAGMGALTLTENWYAIGIGCWALALLYWHVTEP